MERKFKLISKGDPGTLCLFEPDAETILVRVTKHKILAACALWGPSKLFGVNKFGTGIFTDGKRWIDPPAGETAASENELRDALRKLAGAKIARFDRGDPVYHYGNA